MVQQIACFGASICCSGALLLSKSAPSAEACPGSCRTKCLLPWCNVTSGKNSTTGGALATDIDAVSLTLPLFQNLLHLHGLPLAQAKVTHCCAWLAL